MVGSYVRAQRLVSWLESKGRRGMEGEDEKKRGREIGRKKEGKVQWRKT